MPVQMAGALVALCAAGACLPLAVSEGAPVLPSWLWVAGGVTGLGCAVRLLLGGPLRRDAAAPSPDFMDASSASRNAELRAELLTER
ncbi:hypothetical protein RD110_17635 [Rhodoferax koreense]|uniref:Uncharacterized protein n=2 Tax=Rhodoferax koreensis TaxID=1842727 RepID=A0A1P8JYI2_9BURK|nr:hypothetical protein RD110_17635 [Rhodoferax koreense]